MTTFLVRIAGLVLACSAAVPSSSWAQSMRAAERQALKAELRASAQAATAPAAAAVPVRSVTVNCGRGEKIMNALAKHSGPLVVEVRGICSENVLVERSDLTLHGLDPLQDGLRGVTAVLAPDMVPAALMLSRASRVLLENLSFSDGASHGVTADYSTFTVTNCRAERNVYDGFRVSSSRLAASNVVASANLTHGIHADLGSYVSCAACTLEDNVAFAGFSGGGSSLTLGDTHVSGTRGITATGTGSYVDVDCINYGTNAPCSVDIRGTDGRPGWAAYASGGGVAALWGGDYVGGIRADRGGRIELVGARPLLVEGLQRVNLFSDFSVLVVEPWDVPVVLQATNLWGFSHAFLYGTDLQGSLTCDGGSDAVADAAYPASMVSTCKTVPVQ